MTPPGGYSFGDSADGDEDGIPDNVDMCVNTEPGVEVLPIGDTFQGCDADPDDNPLQIYLAIIFVGLIGAWLFVRLQKRDS